MRRNPFILNCHARGGNKGNDFTSMAWSPPAPRCNRHWTGGTCSWSPGGHHPQQYPGLVAGATFAQTRLDRCARQLNARVCQQFPRTKCSQILAGFAGVAIGADAPHRRSFRAVGGRRKGEHDPDWRRCI